MTDAARTPFAEQDDEELTPRASPVDTFVKAQVPQDLTPNLTSLLSGLSKFDTGVSDFIEKQDNAGKADAEAQAKYDALRESAGLPPSSPSGNAHAGMFGGIFGNLFGTDATPLKTPALPASVAQPPADPNAVATTPSVTPTSAGPAVPSPVPVAPSMSAPLPPARPDQGTIDTLASGQTDPLPPDAPAAPPSLNAPAAPGSFTPSSATQGVPNAEGMAIGVGKGFLPAQANPAYVPQLEMSRGELAGEQLKSRFSLEANQAGIGSMTQDQFLQWRRDWLSKNLGSSMTPSAMRGLVPQLDTMMKQGLQQYTVERDKYLKEQGTQAQGAQFNQVLDAANGPVAQGQPLDVQATYDQLSKVRAAWMAVNQDPAKADHQFITAVTAQAVKTGNKDYLTILDQPVPGKDYTYAQTSEGRAAYTNSSDAIDSNAAADAKQALQQKAAQDKAYEQGITSQAMQFIQKNPGQPVPDNIVNDSRMRSIDGTFPQKMAELAKKYAGDYGPQDDPQHVAQLERDIINAGPGQAVGYFHQHMTEVQNPKTLTELNSLAENADKGGPKLQEVLKDPTYVGYHKMIDASIGDPTHFDVFNGQNGQSSASALRKHQMDMAVLNWASAHPNANYLETNQAISNIGQAFTANLPKQPVAGLLPPPPAPPVPDIPPGESAPRAPAPAAAPAAQPAAASAPAPQAPTAPAAAPAPTPQPAQHPTQQQQQGTNADGLTPDQAAQMTSPHAQRVIAAYRALPADQRSVVDDLAAKAGVRPEVYVGLADANGNFPGKAAPAPAPEGLGLSGGGVAPMSYTQPDPGLPTPAPGSDAETLTNAAHQLGTTPHDLAMVIAYESGFRPNIRGGKGGNYTGLIQFGPKEAAKYGVTGNESFAEQMPKVVAFLKDRGYKPGMSLADLYSTINAGTPGKYNASDGHGTVNSHVANMQTAAFEAKVEKFLGGRGATLGGPADAGVIDPVTRKPVPGGYEPSAPAPEVQRIEAAATPSEIAPGGGGSGSGGEGSGGASGASPSVVAEETSRLATAEAAEAGARKRRRRPGKDSGSQQA